MKRHTSSLTLTGAFLLMALVTITWPTGSVRAHGIGTPQAMNVPAGPYMLSAWTDPSPLRVDETHIVVAVADPTTREMIVSGVEVTITMSSLADPSIVHSATAGTDNVNQLLYAAEFNGRVTEGAWRVGIRAAGPLGASDEINFDVIVGPARSRGWLWLGIGGMTTVTMLWFVSASRPAAPPRPARSRRSRGR